MLRTMDVDDPLLNTPNQVLARQADPRTTRVYRRLWDLEESETSSKGVQSISWRNPRAQLSHIK